MTKPLQKSLVDGLLSQFWQNKGDVDFADDEKVSDLID